MPPIGPTLANIIAVLSWIAPVFLLPGSLLLIGAYRGPHAIGACLLMGGVLAGGPKNVGFRSACLAVLAATTATAPIADRSTSLTGLVALFIMLGMITEIPGRPKQWGRFPFFRKLLTEILDGRAYYKRAELKGNLKGVKPGKVLYAVHPHGGEASDVRAT